MRPPNGPGGFTRLLGRTLWDDVMLGRTLTLGFLEREGEVDALAEGDDLPEREEEADGRCVRVPVRLGGVAEEGEAAVEDEADARTALEAASEAAAEGRAGETEATATAAAVAVAGAAPTPTVWACPLPPTLNRDGGGGGALEAAGAEAAPPALTLTAGAGEASCAELLCPRFTTGTAFAGWLDRGAAAAAEGIPLTAAWDTAVV